MRTINVRQWKNEKMEYDTITLDQLMVGSGMYDQNDQELYSGDIVEVYHNNEFLYNGLVFENNFSFFIQTKESILLLDQDLSFRIIGNIHENNVKLYNIL